MTFPHASAFEITACDLKCFAVPSGKATSHSARAHAGAGNSSRAASSTSASGEDVASRKLSALQASSSTYGIIRAAIASGQRSHEVLGWPWAEPDTTPGDSG